MSEREIRRRLESIGVGVSRYGLVVVLTIIGLLKFTSPEAAGIQPLVAHSPLMSWMYVVLSVQGVSNVIGFIEISTALLIASRPFSPKASFLGQYAERFWNRHLMSSRLVSVSLFRIPWLASP
jgi:reactive chlorine resistance protein C